MERNLIIQELLRIQQERDHLAAQLKQESAKYKSEVSTLKNKVVGLERVAPKRKETSGSSLEAVVARLNTEPVYHEAVLTVTDTAAGTDNISAVKIDTSKTTEADGHHSHSPATDGDFNSTPGEDLGNTCAVTAAVLSKTSPGTAAVLSKSSPGSRAKAETCKHHRASPTSYDDEKDNAAVESDDLQLKIFVCTATCTVNNGTVTTGADNNGTVTTGADNSTSGRMHKRVKSDVKFEVGSSQVNSLQHAPRADAESETLAYVDDDMDCDTSCDVDPDTTQYSHSDVSHSHSPRDNTHRHGLKPHSLKRPNVLDSGTSLAERKTVDTPRRQGGRSRRKPDHAQQHCGNEGERKLFVCTDCGAGFDLFKSLWKHMLKKNIQPFKCKDCGVGFDDEKDFEAHTLTHTGPKPHKCSNCSSCFSRAGHLRIHQRACLQPRPYVCGECGDTFRQEMALKLHMTKHTGEKLYQCDVCGSRFMTIYGLKIHTNIHTHEITYNCTQCHAVFYSVTALRVHQRIHTGEKPFLCSICGTRFTQRGSYNAHMLVHSGERPYKCEDCSATFARVDCLNEHRYVHKSKAFPCSICGACFRSPGQMAKHRRGHAGKVYKCQTCGAGFTQGHSLKTHMLKNCSSYPYRCTQCGRLFSSHDTFKKHQLAHTKRTRAKITNKQNTAKSTHTKTTNKQNTTKSTVDSMTTYLCDTCGETFSDNRTLTRHRNIHIRTGSIVVKKRNRNKVNEGRHKCTKCGSRFVSNYKLQRHMITHSDEKPFKCVVCGANFKHRETWKTHMLVSHVGDEEFKCSECDASFARPSALKFHMHSHTKRAVGTHRCGVCGRSYSRRTHMYRHALKAHPDKSCVVLADAGEGLRIQVQNAADVATFVPSLTPKLQTLVA